MYYTNESNSKQHEYPTYGRQLYMYKWFNSFLQYILLHKIRDHSPIFHISEQDLRSSGAVAVCPVVIKANPIMITYIVELMTDFRKNPSPNLNRAAVGNC